MNYRHILKALLVLFLQLVFSVQSSKGQIANILEAQMDSVLEAHIKINNLKGAAASVVFPDGSKWSHAKGDYGTTQLNSDMLYEIGSNTKSMVATIILLLEEEGKLNIDDTLYKYISPMKYVTSGITLRQLLRHTSGLYDFTQHPDFFDYVNNNPFDFVASDTILKGFMANKRSNPGVKWEYCNTNYILLGYVIEAVEQKKFHQVLRERIFTPFGLSKSFLSDYESHSFAEAGFYQNGNHWNMHFSSFLSSAWSAGAVLSTTEDLASYAFKLYGGKILSENSLKQMLSVPIGSTYGLGMIRRTHGGNVYVGHGGTTLQNSYMDYSLKYGFSCVTVTIEANVYQPSENIHEALLTFLAHKVPNYVGLDKVEEESINIFPNPATNKINIQAASGQKEWNQGEIIDYTGKKMLSFGSESKLDISGLESGLYIIRLYSKKGQRVGQKKLIVK